MELVVTTLCGYGTGRHYIVWIWKLWLLNCLDMELVVTVLCGYGTGCHYIVWIWNW